MGEVLKLVTTSVPSVSNVVYISGKQLLYKSDNVITALDPGKNLVKCSDLKNYLDQYLPAGTKFIASTYNPVLNYLLPGYSDDEFSTDNHFIPTLDTNNLNRGESDSFGSVPRVKPESLISIKACDNWYNNPDTLQRIVGKNGKLNEELRKVYGSGYADLDYNKELMYSVSNVAPSLQSGVFSEIGNVECGSVVKVLISSTTYTDTLDLSEWIQVSCFPGVSGKVDVSVMYSKSGNIYSSDKSLKAFEYKKNSRGVLELIVDDSIIDMPEVQVEYLGGTLRIVPKTSDVDEAIIGDCILTVGTL